MGSFSIPKSSSHLVEFNVPCKFHKLGDRRLVLASCCGVHFGGAHLDALLRHAQKCTHGFELPIGLTPLI